MSQGSAALHPGLSNDAPSVLRRPSAVFSSRSKSSDYFGTRKAKLALNRLGKTDVYARALRIALEIEDANLNAKRYFGGDIGGCEGRRGAGDLRAEVTRSCPGRGAARLRGAPQSRDPLSSHVATWAPDQQRTAKARCAASGARDFTRGTRDSRTDNIASNPHSHNAARRDGWCRGTAGPARPAGSSWQSRCRQSLCGNARAT